MYLELARNDITVARILLEPRNNPGNDEMITNIAAYHVQQGLEKGLKHIIHDINGLDDSTKRFRSHSLTSLISVVEDECGITIIDDLKIMSETITEWESESRYGGSFSVTKSEIERGIELFEELTQIIDEKYHHQ